MSPYEEEKAVELLLPNANATLRGQSTACHQDYAWVPFMRLLSFLLAILILSVGCATRQYERNSLTATGQALIDPKLEPAQGRREAIQTAEVRARDNLMLQVLKMKMNDGRTIEQVAAKDPYVSGIVQDSVRASHPTGTRNITDTSAELSVRMELMPIHKLIRTYNPAER